MLVGTLAISGVPFFSGFYSKDAILAAALARVMQNPRHFLLFLLPALGAVLTAFYMFRMWFLTFAGEPRGFPATPRRCTRTCTTKSTRCQEHGHHGHGHGHDPNPAAHAHESEPIMTWPLIVLAVLQRLDRLDGLGIVPLPFGTPTLEHCSNSASPTGRSISQRHHYYALAASLLIMLMGIGLGLLYYAPRLPLTLCRLA